MLKKGSTLTPREGESSQFCVEEESLRKGLRKEDSAWPWFWRLKRKKQKKKKEGEGDGGWGGWEDGRMGGWKKVHCRKREQNHQEPKSSARSPYWEVKKLHHASLYNPPLYGSRYPEQDKEAWSTCCLESHSSKRLTLPNFLTNWEWERDQEASAKHWAQPSNNHHIHNGSAAAPTASSSTESRHLPPLT